MHSHSLQYSEQERYLPLANISRVMRKILPAKYKVSKEAKQSMQESLSEFIAFISSEAGEKCYRDKRKTITGDDLLFGFSKLGFELYFKTMNDYFVFFKDTFNSQ